MSMTAFAARRGSSLSLLVAVTLAAIAIHAALSTSLYSATYFSGWLLLSVIVFLALYSIRKKLSPIPLGSSAVWLRLHVVCGLFSFVVFVLHAGMDLPNGVFESVLAACYLAVFASGVLGLFVSRTFPRRLTARGPEVIYERIEAYRQHLQHQAERVLENHFSGEDNPVAQFYAGKLQHFFEKPRHLLPHLYESAKPQRQLVSQLNMLNQYLDSNERKELQNLAKFVQLKNDLDHQYALQCVLKHWPFIHVPLTYSLLLLSVYHLVLVHAFLGSR